jgi:hypothetical protein
MLLKAIMELSLTTSHLFEIVMGAIGLLLAIVGYFLSFYFRRSIRTTDKLNESVTGLNVSVQLLNQTMEGFDERLRNSEKKIERHDRSIACIKTVLKIPEDHDGK